MISALSGFASLIIVFLWLRKTRDNDGSPLIPYLAAFFLGWNYLFLSNNRIGMTESLMIFFILLSVMSASRQTTLAHFLSGSFLFMAMLVKSSALFMYPVLFAFWMHQWLTKRHSWAHILAWCGGTFSIFFIWFYFIFPTYWDTFIGMMLFNSDNTMYDSWYKIPAGFVSLFFWFSSGKLHTTTFIAQTSVLFCLIYWILLSYFNRILHHGARRVLSKLSTRHLLVGLWLIAGILFLVANQYKPERRFIFLIPPMALLAAELIGSWLNTNSRKSETLLSLLGCDGETGHEKITLFLFTIPFALFMTPVFYNFFLDVPTIPGRGDWLKVCLFLFLLNALVTPIMFVFRSYWRRKAINLFTTAILMVSLFAAINTYRLIDYFSNLTFTLFTTSQTFASTFDENTVVMGKLADTVCVETKAFAFTPYHAGKRQYFNPNPIERFNPDYMLILYQVYDFIMPDQ